MKASFFLLCWSLQPSISPLVLTYNPQSSSSACCAKFNNLSRVMFLAQLATNEEYKDIHVRACQQVPSTHNLRRPTGAMVSAFDFYYRRHQEVASSSLAWGSIPYFFFAFLPFLYFPLRFVVMVQFLGQCALLNLFFSLSFFPSPICPCMSAREQLLVFTCTCLPCDTPNHCK
ncbi:hypothetical protein F5Y17DRAFT_267933 [Xylariaceae sp. FL0594]|nr:hypothetical protein F5Y17DRAFT_267933 [Xylariaceae sp. FL0594]